MKSEKLYDLIEKEVLPKCREIMKSKGEAYSGKEDKLGNFKRCAKMAGTTPEKTLFTYATKHWDAISAYVREEYCDSEPIEGRIMDVVNYMFLLFGLVREKQDELSKSNGTADYDMELDSTSDPFYYDYSTSTEDGNEV